jgi:hypothetical protein
VACEHDFKDEQLTGAFACWVCLKCGVHVGMDREAVADTVILSREEYARLKEADRKAKLFADEKHMALAESEEFAAFLEKRQAMKASQERIRAAEAKMLQSLRGIGERYKQALQSLANSMTVKPGDVTPPPESVLLSISAGVKIEKGPVPPKEPLSFLCARCQLRTEGEAIGTKAGLVCGPCAEEMGVQG